MGPRPGPGPARAGAGGRAQAGRGVGGSGELGKPGRRCRSVSSELVEGAASLSAVTVQRGPAREHLKPGVFEAGRSPQLFRTVRARTFKLNKGPGRAHSALRERGVR